MSVEQIWELRSHCVCSDSVAHSRGEMLIAQANVHRLLMLHQKELMKTVEITL